MRTRKVSSFSFVFSTTYRPSGFLAAVVVATPLARGVGANLGLGDLFVTDRSGDLVDGVLLPAEETVDFALLMAGDLPETMGLAELMEGDLPYFEVADDVTVLMGEGRVFAGVEADFVDIGDLDFGAAGVEVGSAFRGADVEGNEAVVFVDVPEPASARLPPV